MSRPSVRSAARQFVKRTTVEQKHAYLELLLKQWGALYAEQVARKADVLCSTSPGVAGSFLQQVPGSESSLVHGGLRCRRGPHAPVCTTPTRKAQ